MSDDAPAGAPAWVMTFADLMSLLMCFFVLLLSFAEMDVVKFKKLAGSMEMAFGVQRKVEAMEIPKGTSIIAQEFSAGKPTPTVTPEVKQKTTEIEKPQLDTNSAVSDEQIQSEATKIKEALKEEEAAGKIEIEVKNRRIIIRIMERGSFPSGSSVFHEDFLDVMMKISRVLSQVDGNITVAGHTDNVPIRTEQFRSNWELSSSRAVSVMHALMEEGDLDPKRFVIKGHADTVPRFANDTPQHKAKNRRVEIVITKRGEGDNESSKSFEELKKTKPETLQIDEETVKSKVLVPKSE